MWWLLATLAFGDLPMQQVHLPDFGLFAESIQPVEADGDPATQEWLLQNPDGLYRLVFVNPAAIAKSCVTAPFHPHGTAPSLIVRAPVPVLRVGTRDKFVAFDASRQLLTIWDMPDSCTP